MFSFLFGKSKKDTSASAEPLRLKVDIHSHLLPGLDDGAQNIENSVEMIERFALMGYKKLITTPHIMWDYYKNTPELIGERLEFVRSVLKSRGIEIELEAAAEYYLDEYFLSLVENGKPLLSFGSERYLLIETSYMSPNQSLHHVIFRLRAEGYQPILAHPERYTYFFGKYDEILQVREKGCLLQVNANSLTSYYSKTSKQIAEKLIAAGAVSFLGSDCHKIEHLGVLSDAMSSPFAAMARDNLLNDSLL